MSMQQRFQQVKVFPYRQRLSAAWRALKSEPTQCIADEMCEIQRRSAVRDSAFYARVIQYLRDVEAGVKVEDPEGMEARRKALYAEWIS